MFGLFFIMQFSFLAYFFVVLIFLSTNSLIQGVEEQPKAMKPAPGSLRTPDLTVHEPRHQWKKFVGMSGEEVKTAILHENNELNVQYLRHVR